MSSSTPPGDYPMRQQSTLYLRVPFADWNEVRIGAKRQFRTTPRAGALIRDVICPTPVVCYTVNKRGARAGKLMVLEDQRRERLIDIATSQLDLSLEGFESYDLFKAYWKKRHNGVFRALQPVVVYTVRQWEDADEERMGKFLLKRLYDGFLQKPPHFSEHVKV
jgi:hypothetical protein